MSIETLKTTLDTKDKIGRLKARLGIQRHNYKVRPGLYAVGQPNDKSLVLVTSNYKLTVDMLRKELTGQNLWILVLNTMGVNVWCAAGKGTFGTRELISKINSTKLSEVVSHRTLILPQLGAPGMEAHVITKETGFKVIYGPVRAADIPQFLRNNLQASKKMREVQFDVVDRIEVSLLEFVHSMKFIGLIFLFFLIYNLINKDVNFVNVIGKSLLNTSVYAIAAIIGTLIIPMILPYIPFRSFALKGAVVGVLYSLIIIKASPVFGFHASMLINTANILIVSAIISFLSLNFTGSSTYTSLSGVQKETLYSVPIMAAAGIIGVILLIISKVLSFIG